MTKELRKQYVEAEVGDFIKVPSQNSEIPLWAGEVHEVCVEDGARQVHFGDTGLYLMEKKGQIGVFR